jgi:hypothetical protein
MRIFNPDKGTRMSVPDRMAGRYLGQGWVPAGGSTPVPDTPAQDPVPSPPSGDAGPDQVPPGVVTLSGGQVPDGTAKDVIDWVGDDQQRARQALAAEQAKGDEARTTLVARLSKIAGL